ncbi:hypothetical protein QF037_000826 [Streptomyces canus]|uniref:hypothetical protein n=1 Tax=Streptomyces canus TaxID=58343 RepID=UPI0027880866|nr:hypothetical protein [Streptomyces canus]MDQ0596481.1 hypothetical protein [Streptomyces canus]
MGRAGGHPGGHGLGHEAVAGVKRRRRAVSGAAPRPHLRDTAASVDLLYPSASRAVPAWSPDTAELSLTLPTAPSAVLLRVTPTGPGAP